MTLSNLRFFVAAGLLLSVAASAEEFKVPNSCKAGLDVEIALPCADAATQKLYTGKNMGLAFSGVGSFRVPRMDQLAVGSYDDNGKLTDANLCMGSFTIKDSTQIEHILKGQLTPYTTVAPGDGHWVHYAGVAVGKAAAEGSGLQAVPHLDGDNCYVTFTLGRARTTGDMNAAAARRETDLRLARTQCEDELGKGVLIQGGRSADAGSFEGACRDAVEDVAKFASASPVWCGKTIVTGQGVNPQATDDSARALMCTDKDTLSVISGVDLREREGKIVAEATPLTSGIVNSSQAGSANAPDSAPQ